MLPFLGHKAAPAIKRRRDTERLHVFLGHRASPAVGTAFRRSHAFKVFILGERGARLRMRFGKGKSALFTTSPSRIPVS